MAISTPSVADVRVIYTTDASDASITAIIADVALMAEPCITNLASDRQAAIVKYLTAHVLSLADNDGASGIVSSKLGDAQTSYAQAALGRALNSSHFGQMAMTFDTNGCLATLGNRRAFWKAV